LSTSNNCKTKIRRKHIVERLSIKSTFRMLLFLLSYEQFSYIVLSTT
jgi:hypothetical protein